MAQLAIRGHATRGKEVIELLEMLGGKNIHNYDGTFNECYVIDNDKICSIYTRVAQIDGFVIITLEEFLEKFPHKIGDKVKVFGNPATITGMVWDEGINEVVYSIQLNNSKYKTTKLANQIEPDKMEIPEKLMPRIDFNEYCKDKYILDLGNYEIKEENGKTYAVRKQLEYPKTYKECCEVLGCKADDFFTDFAYNGCGVEISNYEDKLDDLLQNFRKLIYCRDAYWKIAGEQMGLGKPWKPDWKDDNDKYFICYLKDKLWASNIRDCNRLLVFPTEEIRDAFFENFKTLIEICKELL